MALQHLIEPSRSVPVSVPFTRGTPPWHWQTDCHSKLIFRFSPLHEGDTSVAASYLPMIAQISGFSPLHEGDTSVA